MLRSIAELGASTSPSMRDWLVTIVATSLIVGSCNCPDADQLIAPIPNDASAPEMVDVTRPDLLWSVVVRGDLMMVRVTDGDGEEAEGIFVHSPAPVD